jgi:formylglycine-generating enzyme required for sulfatase activity
MAPTRRDPPLRLETGAEPIPGYCLLQRLGGGGFGEVWKTKGPGGFQVALKFVKLTEPAGPVERRALEIIKQIHHPHLLTTFGSWEIPGFLVIAMELARGTLWDRFREAVEQGLDGIPPDELLEYFREAAKAIDYLNEHRPELGGLAVQHRDIKPQNILLIGNGVKVGDFGLARVMEHTVTGHSGSLTVAYAAPEFFRGQVASQSDQYSLAVTYCHMRGGRLPFNGNPVEIIGQQLAQKPDLTMLPAEERPVLARALALMPPQRWPSCRAFVEQLLAARSAAATAPGQRAQTVAPAPGQRAQPVAAGPKGAHVSTAAVGGRQTGYPVAAGPSRPDEFASLPAGNRPTQPPRAETSRAPKATAPLPPPLPPVEAPRRWQAPERGGRRGVRIGATVLVAAALLGLAWWGLAALQKDEPGGPSGRAPEARGSSKPAPNKRPPQPEESSKPTADKRTPEAAASLELLLPKSVSVQTGMAERLEITVHRTNVDGPVQLTCLQPPHGIIVESVTMPAGKDRVQTMVRADAGDSVGSHRLRMAAICGNTRTEASLDLVVRSWPVMTNSIGMKLVLIPRGKFRMGSPEGEKGREANEGPQHEVEITRPFYLGQYTVTRGQFRRFVQDTGYKTEAEIDGTGGNGYEAATRRFARKPAYTWRDPGFAQTDEHPVVNVSWNDAVAFCRWLSCKEGRDYRLPTEAEWEYSCRAGAATRFYHGDDEAGLRHLANVADKSFAAKFDQDYVNKDFPKATQDWLARVPWDDGFPFTAPVGQFRPNLFGLYDMHGNVWQWCTDWYDKDYYGRSPRQDPQGPESGSARVFRGGCWLNPDLYCRAACRLINKPPHFCSIGIGFRVQARPSEGRAVVDVPVDPDPRIALKFLDPNKERNKGMSFGILLTKDRDPSGGPKKLTYSDEGWTSNTVLRVDNHQEVGFGSTQNGRWIEREGRLGKDRQGRERRGLRSVWISASGDIQVTQTAEIVPSVQASDVGDGKQARLLDTCLVRYKVENKGTQDHIVGIRFMLDTFIGANDGVPFTIPGQQELCSNKKELTGDQIPDFVQALERPDLKNPGTIAQLTLKVGGGLEVPQRVLLTHWPGTTDGWSGWEVPLADIGADSAIAMFWKEKVLRPGESRSLGFAYGLGTIASTEVDGKLGVTLGGSFEPQSVFTVTAYVTNPVRDEELALTLPPGLKLDQGFHRQPVPPLAKTLENQKNAASVVTWKVRIERYGKYSLRVGSSRGPSQIKTITISRGGKILPDP